MNEKLLIKRYSNSLFQLAKKKKKLDITYKKIIYIKEICKNEPRIQQILSNPSLNSKNKLNVLKSLLNDKDHSLIYYFFLILLKNKRENMVCHIFDQFVEDYDNFKKIKKGILTVSERLSENIILKIESIFCKLLKFEKINLIQVVDKKILGGFKIRIESFYLDVSIKSKLERLSKKLKNTFN